MYFSQYKTPALIIKRSTSDKIYRHSIVQMMFFLLISISTKSFADITLPRLLSDGAILQQGSVLTLWGQADKGEHVSLLLNGKEVATSHANPEAGGWQLILPAQKAGGPHRLAFKGRNTVVLNDIYFGEVWLASGQSNMQLPMGRVSDLFSRDIESANDNTIRMFNVPLGYDFNAPATDFQKGSWEKTTPESVTQFSAVAYFFAKALQQKLQVPIGIINASYGGSTAEGWMSESALRQFPFHLNTAKKFRYAPYLDELKQQDQANQNHWYQQLDANDLGLTSTPRWYDTAANDNSWQSISMPMLWPEANLNDRPGSRWLRKTVQLPPQDKDTQGLLYLGRIVDADTVYVNGVKVGGTTYQYPPRRYKIPQGILKAGANTIAVRVISNGSNGGLITDKPYFLKTDNTHIDLHGDWKTKQGTVLDPLPAPLFQQYTQPLGFYNAMLAPVQKMQISGVIWYQGESNVSRADEYKKLFPAMINDWRQGWQQKDLPFIFVQLANYLEQQETPQESDWAELRDAQASALALPNTAMITAIDLGEWNDIHPLDKKSVGERLSLAARKLVYGEATLLAQGPTVEKIQAKGTRLIVTFGNTGDGLAIAEEQKKKINDAQGFAICGADGVYYWAQAQIRGNKIELSHPKVSAPIAVRYAWADNPKANIVNSAGLPAFPFQIQLKSR